MVPQNGVSRWMEFQLSYLVLKRGEGPEICRPPGSNAKGLPRSGCKSKAVQGASLRLYQWVGPAVARHSASPWVCHTPASGCDSVRGWDWTDGGYAGVWRQGSRKHLCSTRPHHFKSYVVSISDASCPDFKYDSHILHKPGIRERYEKDYEVGKALPRSVSVLVTFSLCVHRHTHSDTYIDTHIVTHTHSHTPTHTNSHTVVLTLCISMYSSAVGATLPHKETACNGILLPGTSPGPGTGGSHRTWEAGLCPVRPALRRKGPLFPFCQEAGEPAWVLPGSGG